MPSNANNCINTETATVRIRRHGLRISAIDVTALHELSEYPPTNSLLHLRNKASERVRPDWNRNEFARNASLLAVMSELKRRIKATAPIWHSLISSNEKPSAVLLSTGRPMQLSVTASYFHNPDKKTDTSCFDALML
jgi:hypothetical protein